MVILKPLTVDNTRYRNCAGIMLVNKDRKIFVGQRLDNIIPAWQTWQMPQGGIEQGEAPRCAAQRELLEEAGINHVDYLAEITEWLYYDVPTELACQVWQGRYKGQRQRWFAYKYLGNDDEININTAQPEFKDWRWVTPDQLIDLAVSFKQELYQYLVLHLYHQIF